MKLSEIPDGQVFSVFPPKIQEMISGVCKVGFYPDGKIILLYQDGVWEQGTFKLEEAQALADQAEDSIFPVVSAVQGKRQEVK